jgi:large subunit ribosomal protein L4
MPKKMRRAALRSALSVKAAEKEIVIVDEVKVKEPKTSIIAEAIEKLVGDSSALILLPAKGEEEEKIIRSSRNLQKAKILLANYLNIRDLLGYDKVIVPLKSLDVIVGYLGK